MKCGMSVIFVVLPPPLLGLLIRHWNLSDVIKRSLCPSLFADRNLLYTVDELKLV